MISWYVEISEWAPETYNSDKYLKTIIDTATPFMNHFCKRLNKIDDWKLEDANRIFKDLVEELPIMQAQVFNDDFLIRYNKWTYIKLTDTVKQIYRESKLNKLLT
jgi:hypothetical protein